KLRASTTHGVRILVESLTQLWRVHAIGDDEVDGPIARTRSNTSLPVHRLPPRSNVQRIGIGRIGRAIASTSSTAAASRDSGQLHGLTSTWRLLQPNAADDSADRQAWGVHRKRRAAPVIGRVSEEPATRPSAKRSGSIPAPRAGKGMSRTPPMLDLEVPGSPRCVAPWRALGCSGCVVTSRRTPAVSPTPRAQGRVRALDGLRGVAVLLVVAWMRTSFSCRAVRVRHR
ncbi:MAG: hypothetical protein JWM72_1122, partial [Actinomycetia bacterium]|nr:hypothetical protein [Actinomycetes bacterium]